MAAGLRSAAHPSRSGRLPGMAYLTLIFGVFCCATSVIFIRTSTTDPVLLSAYRLLLGALLLYPAYRRARRRHPGFAVPWTRPAGWIPALLLAFHFVTWIFGARETPAANATLLVNMTPVVMPLLLWLIAREMITVGEGIGSAVALLGVFLLLGADLQFSGERVLGDVVCFFSMVLYTGYLAFARRNRAIPSIYLYVVPLYAQAGVACLLMAAVKMAAVGEFELIGSDLPAEVRAIVGLAAVPTVIGHSLINRAFKHLRGQAVSTINLSQVIFASIMAALLLDEIPGFELYFAAILILSGAFVAVRSGHRVKCVSPPLSRCTNPRRVFGCTMMGAQNPAEAPGQIGAVLLLVFNSRHQIWVEGTGQTDVPWTPPVFDPVQETTDLETFTNSAWPGIGRLQPFLERSVKNETKAVWWARWDHRWEESPIPGRRGQWMALANLREEARRCPASVADDWHWLLPQIHARAIEIPYLNFGPNQFIYRFRTDKQRNRAVYQDDATSQELYQSHLCAAVKAARRLKENRSGEPARLDFGAVEYLLPSHFGFCLGVQNAIERAYEVIAEHPRQRVFMLSELIHNPFVNKDLQRRGLRYLQTDKGLAIEDPATGRPFWDSLTEDDIVIIPAFGATNEDKVRLIERGLALNEFDATCMLVEKVWKAGRRFAEDGYTVVIHGKAEHEETKATFSNIARYGPALVVRDLNETEHLAALIRSGSTEQRQRLLETHFAGKTTAGFQVDRDLERLAVVNQTTLLRNETLRIIDLLESALAERHAADPSAHLHPQSRGDTLCYATQVNQDALQRALSEPLDLALVAGGRNSSNTYQLYRVCKSGLGEHTAYIQSEENLLPSRDVLHYHFGQSATDPRAGSFEKRPIPFPEGRPMRVLITGGASCPDGIIQQIIARMNAYFPAAALRSIETVLSELEFADS